MNYKKQENDVLFLDRCPKRSDEVVKDLTEAKEQGRLEEALLEIFSKYEMDMLIIWKCREFFRSCPDDFYKKNMHLLSYRTLVEAMAGNIEEAKRYESFLDGFPEELQEYTLTAMNLVKMMIKMVMPYYDNKEFFRITSFLASSLKNPIKALAVTACRPSVINGFRDTTEIGPLMENHTEKIIDIIYKIYGNSGKGVYEVALAEWKYEIGDTFNALLLVAGTIPALEAERDIRCLFVAFVLQMKILIFGGQTKSTSEMFENIREKVKNRRFEELEASLEAAICLYHCYEGDYEYIEDWLTNVAPNENDEIFMMDMYSYFVKMRCYLQTGKYMMTLLLSRKLTQYLQKGFRPHDVCECYILSAMACLKAGDKENAYIELDKALEIGSKLGYVRVFGDEGQIMLDLLSIYNLKVSKKEALNVYDSSWIKRIKGVALEISNRYPDYLKSESELYGKLSKSEQQVLHMMAQGFKNDEIAFQLNVKTVTVKFHITNIFKKLMVQNRQQAINRAREIGYLE